MGRDTDYTDGARDTFNHLDPLDLKFFEIETYAAADLIAGEYTQPADDFFKDCFKNDPEFPIDYKVLRPSFQLATRLIQLPRYKTFLHSVLELTRSNIPGFVSNYVEWHDPKRRWIRGIETKPSKWDPDRLLPVGEENIGLDWIFQMWRNGCHTFIFHASDEEPITIQSYEKEDRLTTAGFKAKGIDFICDGYRSETKIPRHLYTRLEDATKANHQDVPQLLWFRFDFAITLVHELCHAARACSERQVGYGAVFWV